MLVREASDTDNLTREKRCKAKSPDALVARLTGEADQPHGGHHLPTGDHAGDLQSDHHDEHDHENEDDKKTSEME